LHLTIKSTKIPLFCAIRCQNISKHVNLKATYKYYKPWGWSIDLQA